MSGGEMLWRLRQRWRYRRERRRYGAPPTPVVAIDVAAPAPLALAAIELNYANSHYSLARTIPLLGGYDYDTYATAWHAAFNTPRTWPLTPSYKLDYRHDGAHGEARINWELNRHHQFALLAKDFYASRKEQYLSELTRLFDDWVARNPFLYGIAWTSTMEVALRVSNWCYAYAFLNKTGAAPALCHAMERGIITMTDYLTHHYSRYSSANNHLIVEMYAIGLVGVATQRKDWIALAIATITRELPRQNYSDGINKELSLHYHAFFMEAVGLLLRVLQRNGIAVPDIWTDYLTRMSEYLANCLVGDGAVAFGDNDEGKILDLQATPYNYYEYVLGLMSFLLPQSYVDEETVGETLAWLFHADERRQLADKPRYRPTGSVCYAEGGNSLLRSSDGRALVGIDHAALGFGTLAAHGHSDALSFVLFIDEKPLIVDPGTYVYHWQRAERDYFCSTAAHNTVCINGKDQSQRRGAFLWGRKARCTLLHSDLSGAAPTLTAQHDGYKPILHRRTFTLDGAALTIEDTLSAPANAVATLTFHPDVTIATSSAHALTLHSATAETMVTIAGGQMTLHDVDYSPAFGVKMKTKAAKIAFSHTLTTTIRWGRAEETTDKGNIL